MSELISGKEAAQAFINGEQVEFLDKTGQWRTIFDNTVLRVFRDHDDFRLKPRTVNLNGVEVPAPFDSSLKHKQYAYVLNTVSPDGYSSMKFYEGGSQPFICWTDEEEIKQVVAALRSIFKPQ